MLQGDILLNLDSEDDGEIFIGCAGGVDTVCTFTSFIFSGYHSGIFVESSDDLMFVCGRHANYGMSGAGDRIAQVAAVDLGQAQLMFLKYLPEETSQHLVGIGMTQMNVAAGVAAESAADADLEIEEIRSKLSLPSMRRPE